MPTRSSPSFTLPILVLFACLSLVLAFSAQAEPSRLGSSWGVERIRAEAREGDVVSLEGRVVSVSRSRFFTLVDESGGRIVTVIPNHLQREIGAPKTGETIRVRGQYDHKTFLDYGKTSTSDPQKTWGIRVTAVDRNLTTSGRNPEPADRPMPGATPAPAPSGTPAAPADVVMLGAPTVPMELKDRLSIARKRVLAAQENLDDANAAQARGAHQNLEGAEMDAISEHQRRALQEYADAVSEIPPLVDEARQAGLDPKLIELYEAGITKPSR
jgi:hypothetical protein